MASTKSFSSCNGDFQICACWVIFLTPSPSSSSLSFCSLHICCFGSFIHSSLLSYVRWSRIQFLACCTFILIGKRKTSVCKPDVAGFTRQYINCRTNERTRNFLFTILHHGISLYIFFIYILDNDSCFVCELHEQAGMATDQRFQCYPCAKLQYSLLIITFHKPTVHLYSHEKLMTMMMMTAISRSGLSSEKWEKSNRYDLVGEWCFIFVLLCFAFCHHVYVCILIHLLFFLFHSSFIEPILEYLFL